MSLRFYSYLAMHSNEKEWLRMNRLVRMINHPFRNSKDFQCEYSATVISELYWAGREGTSLGPAKVTVNLAQMPQRE